MISREKIIEEIEKVPDERLGDLYRVIKDFEANEKDELPDESVMAKLRKIKISASPDFSLKANLYNLEDRDAE